MMDTTRRIFIQRAAQGALFLVSYPIFGSKLLYASIDPTPPNTEGPYYKEGAPYRTNLVEPGEPGTPLTVSGQVLDTEQMPLPNAILEIWHANDSGEYDLDGYKHRGKIPIQKDGSYRYKTVLPGNYGGRPRHIHYKISASEHQSLITQLYFESDSFFSGDPDKNLRKDPVVMYRQLIRPVTMAANQAAVFFRISLKRA